MVVADVLHPGDVNEVADRPHDKAAGESDVSVVAGATRDSVQFWLPEVGASESASSPGEI